MGVEKASLLQPDVEILLQEAILSLCERKYCHVGSLEVDAIICISLVDSVEQQVVKIHQTVNKALQNGTLDSGDVRVDSFVGFQKRRNTSNLSSNYECCETTETSAAELEPASSSRKRRRKQATTCRVDDGLPSSKSCSQDTPLEMTVDSVAAEGPNSSIGDTTGHGSVVVKIEPEDEGEYYASALDQKQCRDVSISPHNHDRDFSKSVQLKDSAQFQTFNGEDSTVENELEDRPGSVGGADAQVKNEPEDSRYLFLSDNQPEGNASTGPCENNSVNTDDGELVTSQIELDDQFNSRDSSQDEEDTDSQSDINNAQYDEQGVSGRFRSKRRYTQRNMCKTMNWFELVQSNVNRYQAAIKSKMASKGNFGQSERKSEIAKMLQSKVLLPKPTVQVEFLDGRGVETGGEEISKSILEEMKSRVEMPHGSSKCSSMSASPSPDTSGPTSRVNKGSLNQPSGKLESRYPALFSQLQGSREVLPGASNLDHTQQQDSLVNRLPFISFQELFSQSNPTNQSIEDDKQVGLQMSILPSASKVLTSEYRQSFSVKDSQAKPVQTSEPSRENTPKLRLEARGENDQEDVDTDWRPDQSESPKSLSSCTRTIKTRLASGKKKRQNLAEFDNDNDDDDDVAGDDDGGEKKDKTEAKVDKRKSKRNLESMTWHFCKHSCGAKFPSPIALLLHETSCQKNVAFTCCLCGLQFNQEYRWKYHMKKVHNVKDEENAGE